jgi:hypothetical protein
VNCVAIRGFTEDEVPALAELARRKPYVVRFIEFMPLDADEAWRQDEVLTGAEIRALIEERWPLVEIPAKPSSTARRFRFADGAGEIGFVNPVSEPFCSSCDRIRLTADGRLRTCLFSRREWDLKGPLRRGASDDELEGLLRWAVRHKELKHRINEPGFVRASRSMSDRRMMNARMATLALVAAATLVAAGCGGGGGGGGTTTLSKDEFASRITKVCTEGKQKIADLKISLSSVSTIAKSGDKVVDLESEQIDKFKNLKSQAPDEIKSNVDDFIAKAETSRDKLNELVQAAKNGDAAKTASVAPEVTTTGQAVRDAASTFGATC